MGTSTGMASTSVLTTTLLAVKASLKARIGSVTPALQVLTVLAYLLWQTWLLLSCCPSYHLPLNLDLHPPN